MYERIKQNTYYLIVGVLSFLTMTVIPFLGSTVGMQLSFPNTVAGWMVYVGAKLIVSVINVLMFDCFIKQAKINVRDDLKFKKANEILGKIKPVYVPLSPHDWLGKQYRHKGTTIFISSILGSVCLTQALLSYDYISAIVYLFAIIMGCVCGVLQMKKTEIYWTEEYYDYACMVLDQKQAEMDKTNISE